MPRHGHPLSIDPSRDPVTQLRKLRARAGYSQQQLATLAGISTGTVSALERLTSHNAMDKVLIGSLRKLSKVLSTTPTAIYPALSHQRVRDD